jgi:hypothetical protein
MSSSPDPNRLRAAFNRLIYCETVPLADTVLELGAELWGAHLDRFAEHAIDSDFGNIPASILRGMLVAAARFHWPQSTPAERARTNDGGFVRKKLAEIEERDCWPAVRSELVKLFKRVQAEIQERTPPPPEGERAEGTGQPGNPGRKRRCDWQKDQAIAEAWQRARDAGTTKKDFAHDKSLSLKELNRLLNRHAKRPRK